MDNVIPRWLSTIFFAVRRQLEFPMASMGASCELPRLVTHDAEWFGQ